MSIASHQPSPSGARVSTISGNIEVQSPSVLMALAGPQSHLLSEVARHSGAQVNLRGNTILIAGRAAEVSIAERFLVGALKLVENGVLVEKEDVARSLRNLRDDPRSNLVSLLDESVNIATRRKPIVPKGATQSQYIQQIREHDLTFGVGPAGTGKTYLAMAMAAQALMLRQVKRIVLTRPAVEAGERLGFLPGDLTEKVNPYLRPLYDALHDMLDFEKIEQLRERGQIEVAPLAFMRGRTLSESFVILDEAQNTTSEQMRMFLTRLGFQSKAVVTGDVTQTDLPRGVRSGLREAVGLLSNVEGVAVTHFSERDVVRHPLVQRIVVAYERQDAARARDEDARRRSAPATRRVSGSGNRTDEQDSGVVDDAVSEHDAP